ncbi:MAG: hypothetical protein ACREMO_05085, partial [Gemmatimonadales bacterium]
MMRTLIPMFLAAALTLGLAGRAPAQAPLAPTAAQLRVAGELRMEPTAPTADPARLGPTLDLPRRGARRTGAVLMIVGGAGIVTGLLVSEPIVTIAG